MIFSRLLMKRRREHIECESRPGLGCVVYSTPTCPHRRSLTSRWLRGLRITLTAELWWLLLAAMPLVLCGAWFAEFLRADEGRRGPTFGRGAEAYLRGNSSIDRESCFLGLAG